MSIRPTAATVLLLGALLAAPPPADAAGDRLTQRADRFVVRWGTAFNERDWPWIRRHSHASVRQRMGELRALRRETRLPLTRTCEREAGAPAHQRLCSYGLVMEVTPARVDGTMRMRDFAVYR